MLARVFSCAIFGQDGIVVEVEIDTGQGLPAIMIVGLPDAGDPGATEGCRSR
jgi:magnesium chelatase family protein